MQHTRVELTSRFLVYILVAALLFFGAWEMRQLIISIAAMLFIAFIISSGIRPVVQWMEGYRIPRGLAVLLVYLLGFVLVSVVVLIIANEFANQIVSLVTNLPQILRSVNEFLRTRIPFIANVLPLNVLEGELSTYVANLVNSVQFKNLISGENLLVVFRQATGLFGSVAELLVSFITVLMVSVYMLVRKEPAYEGILDLLPASKAKTLRRLLGKIEVSMGSWLIGQISLMFIVGLITYILLLVPGIFDPSYSLDDYALPIALLAGLLEALPNVGPAITLVLTVILSLGTSGLGTVIYVAVAFTLLQNAEGIFIVPMVMKKAVGIDPILCILGIIAGFQLAGVAGAILAIPLIGIVQIIVTEAAAEYRRLEKQRPKLME